jgi:hypothetical protein
MIALLFKGTDHLTCRVMVFCFVQNFFFGQHELEYFFLSRKARIFFPEYNIRLYDKNTESHYFFFPPPKSEYFFQQHWESEYLFRKKTYPPPGSYMVRPLYIYMYRCDIRRKLNSSRKKYVCNRKYVLAYAFMTILNKCIVDMMYILLSW